jgi:hypothetical protein
VGFFFTPGDPRIAFRISEGQPTIRFNALPNGTVPFLGNVFSGRNASWYDPDMRAPCVMNWNFRLHSGNSHRRFSWT